MKKLILLLALAAPAWAEWPSAPEGQGLVTHLLSRPCRVLDTRLEGCQIGVFWPADAPPICPQGRLVADETRHLQFQAAALCHGTTERPVPLGAKGLIVTLTAAEPTGNGNLTLYDPFPVSGVTGPPLASSLNFTAGQNVASSVTMALGQWQGQEVGIPFKPDAALTARGTGTVHVVVDVVGYLANAAP